MDKKIVAVLNDNLPIGIAFNTLAHMSLSLGIHNQEMIGTQLLMDKDNNKYLGMSKYPIIILKTDGKRIQKISKLAKKEGKLIVIDFLKEMYTKYTDEDMKKAIKKIDEFEHYGVLLYGEKNRIDNYTLSFKLWK